MLTFDFFDPEFLKLFAFFPLFFHLIFISVTFISCVERSERSTTVSNEYGYDGYGYGYGGGYGGYGYRPYGGYGYNNCHRPTHVYNVRMTRNILN
uniref:Uncharacterized protein n=1 Tax=Panagrolaimus davidi TaxID=227884 RepID=A0A914PDF3_9BILA